MEVPSRFTLHHVGYAVKEIGPTAKLYMDRYGYEEITPVIHDPAQTAFVQFLRLPGDLSYLEFVAPDGPNSKLASTALRGSVLNHLCYAVDDIEQATNYLFETGMFVLSLPKVSVAFKGRKISWLAGQDRLPIELVERGAPGEL
jgi:methylmalonyl-CoA/ethylmalonyl-CoA epimerase